MRPVELEGSADFAKVVNLIISAISTYIGFTRACIIPTTYRSKEYLFVELELDSFL